MVDDAMEEVSSSPKAPTPRSSSSSDGDERSGSSEGEPLGEEGEEVERYRASRRRGALNDKLSELQGLNGELCRVNDRLGSELRRREWSLRRLRDESEDVPDPSEVEVVRAELRRQAETIAGLQNEITKLNGKHKQACKVLVDRLALDATPATATVEEVLEEEAEMLKQAPSALCTRGPLSCSNMSESAPPRATGCVWNAVFSLVRTWDDMWRASKLNSPAPGGPEARPGQSALRRAIAALGGAVPDDDEEVEGEVNLSHCNLSDRDAVELAGAVEAAKRPVEKLLLGGNRIGWRGAGRLAELLQSKQCVVTTLNLRWNWLGEAGAARLAGALELNNTLIDLDLWKNDVGPGAAAALRDALRHNQSLERLSLWGNRLRDVGVVQLSKGLAENSSLLRLDVADNHVGPEGIEALARALQSPTTALTQLSCGLNPLSAVRGAKALAAALAAPTCRLQVLHADGNLVADAGAAALAAALADNTSLTELNLASNKIAAPGADAVADALDRSSCSVLNRLHLDSNTKLGPAVVNLAHTGLLELTLAHVDLSPRHASHLADTLHRSHLRALNLKDTGLDHDAKAKLRVAANQADLAIKL